MKKVLLATALILSMAFISYGKTNSKNKELVHNLATALKSSETTFTSQTENFNKTSFSFNGKLVSAFYDEENNNLLGFTIPMAKADLGKETLQSIQKKFSSYSIQDVVMFIENNGNFTFYVSASQDNKPTIVLRISPNGKAFYYAKM